MNRTILHPCASLFVLQNTLAQMGKAQHELAYRIDPLVHTGPASDAVFQFACNGRVLVGLSRNLQVIRHELSRVLP